MADDLKVVDDGRRIVEGLDDVIAWARGDENSAKIIPWQAPTSVDVKAIRRKLGMSQREFAAKNNITVPMLSDFAPYHRPGLVRSTCDSRRCNNTVNAVSRHMKEFSQSKKCYAKWKK